MILEIIVAIPYTRNFSDPFWSFSTYDLTDPQSLNRYAYTEEHVGNTVFLIPLIIMDPCTIYPHLCFKTNA